MTTPAHPRDSHTRAHPTPRPDPRALAARREAAEQLAAAIRFLVDECRGGPLDDGGVVFARQLQRLELAAVGIDRMRVRAERELEKLARGRS